MDSPSTLQRDIYWLMTNIFLDVGPKSNTIPIKAFQAKKLILDKIQGFQIIPNRKGMT